MVPLSARSWKSSKIDPSSIGTFKMGCRVSYVEKATELIGPQK
jgi:hypothetical protein